MKSKRPTPRKRTGNTQPKHIASNDSKHRFLIAAIGASAGGIEAFSELMRNLPADTGMAFVLIQHLDPKHHSILTELLSKETSMPVREVTHGMRVEPNHVYVIPPNATMSVSNHTLQIGPRGEMRGAHMSIDHFMRNLAEEQGNCAIAVIHGCVDYILPPRGIARELARIARHPYVRRDGAETVEVPPTDHSGLNLI